VPHATPYFRFFTQTWPSVADLAAAEDADVMSAWAGLGYYARARNLLKCARTVTRDHRGVFPDTADALQALPGIGPYTAAAIAAIAFDESATVVDGNVERVMARLDDIRTPLPDAKPELRAAAARRTPDARPGDYAQAVMDLGATICTPRNPACGLCPWNAGCAGRLAGSAPDLPRKAPKAAKPVRRGIAYLARRPDGHAAAVRRLVARAGRGPAYLHPLPPAPAGHGGRGSRRRQSAARRLPPATRPGPSHGDAQGVAGRPRRAGLSPRPSLSRNTPGAFAARRRGQRPLVPLSASRAPLTRLPGRPPPARSAPDDAGDG